MMYANIDNEGIYSTTAQTQNTIHTNGVDYYTTLDKLFGETEDQRWMRLSDPNFRCIVPNRVLHIVPKLSPLEVKYDLEPDHPAYGGHDGVYIDLSHKAAHYAWMGLEYPDLLFREFLPLARDSNLDDVLGFGFTQQFLFALMDIFGRYTEFEDYVRAETTEAPSLQLDAQMYTLKQGIKYLNSFRNPITKANDTMESVSQASLEVTGTSKALTEALTALRSAIDSISGMIVSEQQRVSYIKVGGVLVHAVCTAIAFMRTTDRTARLALVGSFVSVVGLSYSHLVGKLYNFFANCLAPGLVAQATTPEFLDDEVVAEGMFSFASMIAGIFELPKTPSLSGIKAFVTKAKMITDIASIVRVCHDSLVYVRTDMLGYSKYTPAVAETFRNIDAWIAEVKELPFDIPKGISENSKFASKVHELLKRSTNILATAQQQHIQSSQISPFVLISNKLSAFGDVLRNKLRADTGRNRPLAIHLYSSPGQGKTNCTTRLASDIWMMLNPGLELPSKNEIIYERNPSDQFWSGYSGQHCVLLDDIFQKDDAETRTDAASDIIQMINDCTWRLNMAEITQKDGTFFTSPLVLLTSNARFLPSNCRLQDVNAYYRRFDFYYQVVIPGDYLTETQMANGKYWKVDGKKVERLCGDPYYPIWKFKDPISQKIYTYNEFRQMCFDQFQQYRNGGSNHFVHLQKVGLLSTVEDKSKEDVKITEVADALGPIEEEKPKKYSVRKRRSNFEYKGHMMQDPEDESDSEGEDEVKELSPVFVFPDKLQEIPALADVLYLNQDALVAFEGELLAKVKEVFVTSAIIDNKIEAEVGAGWYTSVRNGPLPKLPPINAQTFVTTFERMFDKKSGVLRAYNSWRSFMNARLNRGDESLVKEDYHPTVEVTNRATTELQAALATHILDAENCVARFKTFATSALQNYPCVQTLEVLCGVVGLAAASFALYKYWHHPEHQAQLTVSGDSVTKAKAKVRATLRNTKLNKPRNLGEQFDGHSVIAQSLDENARNLVHGKIRGNSVELAWYDSKGLTYHSGVNMLFFTANEGLTAYHFFADIPTNIDHLCMRIRGKEYHIPLKYCVVTKMGDDVGKLTVLDKRIPAFANIVAHICELTSADMDFHSITLSVIRKTRFETSIGRGKMTHDLINYRFVSTGDQISILNYIHTNIPTFFGDCGGVYTANNTQLTAKILGIHTAGGKHGGVCHLIKRSWFEPNYAESNFNLTFPKGIERLQGVPLNEVVRLPEKTEIEPSLLNRFDGTDPLTMPAHLRPFRNEDGVVVSPLQKAINKYPDEEQPECSQYDDLLADVTKYFCDTQKQNVAPRTLTLHEAINGVRTYQNIGRIRRASGAGLPAAKMYKGKGKFPMYSCLGCGANAACTCKDLDLELIKEEEERLVEMILQLLDENFDSETFHKVTVALKDERRLVEKVKAGKTRLFSVFDHLINILNRIYFGAWMENHNNDPVNSESSAGINPNSVQWTLLMQRLFQNSDTIDDPVDMLNKDGDFEDYDARIHEMFSFSVKAEMESFYGDDDEDANLIRRNLWLVNFWAPHQVMDMVYRRAAPGNNTSGSFLTFHYNNRINDHSHCLVAVEAARRCARLSLEDFTTKVKRNLSLLRLAEITVPADEEIRYADLHKWLKSYGPKDYDVTTQRSFAGDDHKCVDRQYWYGMNDKAEIYADFGMRYTTVDKKPVGDTIAYRYDRVPYMKRTSRVKNGQWRGMLPLKEVILEIPRWIRGGYIDPRVAVQENAKAAIMELFNYEEDVFNHYSSMLEKSLAACECQPSGAGSYSALYKHYYDTGFEMVAQAYNNSRPTFDNDVVEVQTLVPKHKWRKSFDFGQESKLCGSAKSALHSYAQKYRTVNEPVFTINPATGGFVCVVEMGGYTATGFVCPTKKAAQQDAARAFLAKIEMKAQSLSDQQNTATTTGKEELTSFGDNAALSVHTTGSIIPKQVPGDPYEDQGLHKVLSRNFKILTVPWTGTQVQGTELAVLSFPQALTSQEMISEVLEGFRYFRSGTKVIVKINSTAFHFGQLMVSWIPYYNPTAPHTFNRMTNLWQASNNLTMFCSASTQQSYEFTVPYNCPQLYWDMEAQTSSFYDGIFFGMKIFVAAPLRQVNSTATPSVDVTVFANFVNPEPAGMQFYAQSSNEMEEKKVKSTKGIISDKLDTLSAVATAASVIPEIGGIASVVAKGSKIAAQVARLFGYSQPTTLSDTPVMLPKPTGSLALMTGLSNIEKISVSPDNFVSNDPSIYQDKHDYDRFDHSARLPGIVHTFSYTAATSEDARVTYWPITPLLAKTSTVVVGPNNYDLLWPTTAGLMAATHTFWRGPLKYQIRFVTSKFTTSRVRIVWTPSVPPTSGAGAGNTISKVVDVTGDTTVNFVVPYLRKEAWAKVRPTMTDTEILVENEYNGYISVYVVNKAVSMDVENDTLISGIVLQSGGEGFMVARPSAARLNQTTTGLYYAQSGSLDIPRDCFDQTFDPLIPAQSIIYDEKLLMGDITTRWSEVTKRRVGMMNVALQNLTNQAISVTEYELIFSHPTGILFNQGKDALFLSPFFLFNFSRGGLRWTWLPTFAEGFADNRATCILTAYQRGSLDYVSGPHLAQWSAGTAYSDEITKNPIEIENPYYSRYIYRSPSYCAGTSSINMYDDQGINLQFVGLDNRTSQGGEILMSSGEDLSFGTPTAPPGLVTSIYTTP